MKGEHQETQMHAGDFAGGGELQVHLRLLVQSMTLPSMRLLFPTSLINFYISTLECFNLQSKLIEDV